MSTQFSSIWHINRTLSGATTPAQRGPGSDGNKRVLHIPQSSSITGASPSVLYPGHSLGESHPSAEKQSVYSTAPADWSQVVAVSVLLYGCATWTLTKCIEKKANIRMVRAVLNNSREQHPTKQHLHGYLAPISQSMQVRRTRHTGRCWRSKDQLISDIFLGTRTHRRINVSRPAVQTLNAVEETNLKRWMIGMDCEWESQWSLCYQCDLMIEKKRIRNTVMNIVNFDLKSVIFIAYYLNRLYLFLFTNKN